MAKPRKARIDSASEAVVVMSKAAQVLEPPLHSPLDGDAKPFWTDILAARAKSEWTGHDLTCAADLANAMAQLVENRRLLRAEGEVLKPEGGKEFANPRVAVVHGLHAQVKSARQSLNIHGRSVGEPAEVGKRRQMAREIEEHNAFGEDDLLARPGESLQ